MKLELIDNKKHFWKFSSVWLTSLGTVLIGIFTAWPDAVRDIWLFMPDDLKAALPVSTPKWIAISIVVAGVFSRLIKQPKLSKDNEPDSKNVAP